MGDPRHVLFGSSSPEPESSTYISPERSRKNCCAALCFKGFDRPAYAQPRDEFAGENLCSICAMHSLHGEPMHLHCLPVKSVRVEAIIAELCAAQSQPIPHSKGDS